ncbi:hypothetical protein EVAR_296_1 [Eumeta japonica]|uniref:Uncharacterized protein n=1 Tax=Eumeta variegata TaxID=151549 RepID=A0A4C1S9L4_EUMVA|nr:hypothetical protein EVAR_296_1 [Eumeta japonica]
MGDGKRKERDEGDGEEGEAIINHPVDEPQGKHHRNISLSSPVIGIVYTFLFEPDLPSMSTLLITKLTPLLKWFGHLERTNEEECKYLSAQKVLRRREVATPHVIRASRPELVRPALLGRRPGPSDVITHKQLYHLADCCDANRARYSTSTYVYLTEAANSPRSFIKANSIQVLNAADGAPRRSAERRRIQLGQ